MLGYYQKRCIEFIKLHRICKPLWMIEIDQKYDRIRNSIRRNREKKQIDLFSQQKNKNKIK